jgi:hypothetical protein
MRADTAEPLAVANAEQAQPEQKAAPVNFS